MNHTTARAGALATGQPTYTTGRPCKHGHIAPRSTVSGACTQCAKIARARVVQAYRNKRLKA